MVEKIDRAGDPLKVDNELIKKLKFWFLSEVFGIIPRKINNAKNSAEFINWLNELRKLNNYKEEYEKILSSNHDN